jgi:hypothetical protein
MSSDGPVTLASLALQPVWVAWKQDTRDGSATKVPYDPRTGRRAAVDDARTWATQGEVQDWAAMNGAADPPGVPIVLASLISTTPRP